jgi:high-affinity iron transporter
VLATFVIGLREGLEAALIVGIIAAFLRPRGHAALLARVWYGVGLAIVLCLGVGVGLQVLSANLPQQQQEGLETIVGFAAVAMLSYMILWMRQHARAMKEQLEAATAHALATGSAWALVAMAFLAVLREGLETAVFLLATFQASENAGLASLGAFLGVIVAAGVGYGPSTSTEPPLRSCVISCAPGLTPAWPCLRVSQYRVSPTINSRRHPILARRLGLGRPISP